MAVRRARAAAMCVAAVALAALTACSEEELPALGADVSRTSVSGLSAGAYMAGQFQFAHARIVTGAGLVAGGPYGCAESILGGFMPVWSAQVAQNLNRAVNGCMSERLAAVGVPDVDRLGQRVRERVVEGTIDPLKELTGDRVYLFSGGADRTVARALVRKAGALYEALGVPEENIAFVENPDAGHGFVTEDTGNACASSKQPYLNDCDYDQAGAILEHIHGEMTPPGDAPQGRFVTFAQPPFAESDHGLDGAGFVYVPRTCAQAPGCGVHVVFHGCKQGRESVGDAFAKGAGYARWADTNRLIVLFPQVEQSSDNPRGCWDWWGYTGPDFLTRDAPQIKAVRAMLARLAETPAS